MNSDVMVRFKYWNE